MAVGLVRTPMLQLIYTSVAAKPFTDTELEALLLKSRVRNHSLGATGMLLHDAGSFLQVLEGEAGVIRGLYARIAADARHSKLVIVLESSIERREFGDWKMGVVSLDRARTAGMAGLDELLSGRIAGTTAHASGGAQKAREILRAFRAGRWRRYVDT